MGTLFDQPDRSSWLGRDAIEWLIAGMERSGFNPKKPAEVHAFCDLMRTALAIQNADVLDEQLAGFGHILENLVEAIQELKQTED